MRQYSSPRLPVYHAVPGRTAFPKAMTKAPTNNPPSKSNRSPPPLPSRGGYQVPPQRHHSVRSEFVVATRSGLLSGPRRWPRGPAVRTRRDARLHRARAAWPSFLSPCIRSRSAVRCYGSRGAGGEKIDNTRSKICFSSSTGTRLGDESKLPCASPFRSSSKIS
jgi:hypothetical protein